MFRILAVLRRGERQDPTPETNLSSVLRDRTIRLAAAKGLTQRLNTALQQLEKEIARLEQKL